MPVPGTLRKRPVDEVEIASMLERQFNLPRIETLAYLKLLARAELTLQELAEELDVTGTESASLAGRMVEKGLAIRASGSVETLLPLHPRLVLTNIFKMFEKDLVQSLRDRRATVDRVVNLLTPIYEEQEKSPEA
ncbi:MAG TPA: hypothetical protein VFE98_02405 [Candidatus Bathyarchaeia archaeon]|nr:hypothetical protein [Candidatus Bathyarchaeia archaeon]